MSNTEKRDKPVSKIERSVPEQSSSKERGSTQESGVGTGMSVKFPITPQANDKTTKKGQDTHERGEMSLAFLSLLVSVLALVVSLGSCQAARRSADVAAASVRAWVAHTGAMSIGVEGDHVNFKVFLKNVGKTPATAVVVEWGSLFVPGPDQTLAPQFHECPIGGTTRPGVVEAQREWPTTFPSIALSEIQLKMLNEKTGHLYIYGCAKYRDVLDTEKERLTEIALVYPAFVGEGIGIYAPYNRMQ